MAQSMTDTEFKALMPELGRLTVRSVEVAQQVLVHGRDQAEVAREFNLSRQRVSDIVARVQAAADEVPAGWQRVQVWLPPHLAEQVRQMADDALAEVKQES